MTSHYQVLGLSSDATTEQIKLRYKHLILRHHPDKHTGETPLDEEYVHHLLQAWNTLRDPQKRKDYDAHLKASPLRPLVINADVDLDEMVYDEASLTFSLECRCSGVYSITENDLDQGIDVVGCDLCSLQIRVLYDIEE
ncbi:DNAJ heat shock N-terminal domain-containing protein [Spinellus fusiger]|nr:DNAJ heat shock N-terminal domain-containing protein [Spinellus fusiger]